MNEIDLKPKTLEEIQQTEAYKKLSPEQQQKFDKEHNKSFIQREAEAFEKNGIVGSMLTQGAPSSNQQQEAPNFADYITNPNSQATQEHLNSIGKSAQEDISTQPQNISALPPDSYETTRYQKYRNTGVSYFDEKKHLSLVDALLAKQLGLNVSYNFHKIDMKVDSRQSQANYTQMLNRAHNVDSNMLKILANHLTIANNDSGNTLKDALGKRFGDATLGGLVNYDKEGLAATYAMKQNFLESAGRNSGGRITDQQMQEINRFIPNDTMNATSSHAIVGVALTQNIADLQATIRSLEVSNVANPYQIASLKNTLKTYQNVQKIMSSTDAKDKKALQNSSVSIFAALQTLQPK